MQMVSYESQHDELLSGVDMRERQLRAVLDSPETMHISLDHVHADIFPIRDSAVNVVVRLVEAYESKAETLAHAIVLLDRLIAAEFHSRPDSSTGDRIVKSAIGCFMIAVKFREVMHPCLRDLANLSSCTCDEIRSAEEAVVVALNWNISVTTAVDVADKMLEQCAELRRRRLSKYVSFLVQLAYCCREMTAHYSAAAVATACVVFSARILGDRAAEDELIPPFMRGGSDGAVLESLRSVCRSRGYDFREALPPPPPPAAAPAATALVDTAASALSYAATDAERRDADAADGYARTMHG